MLEKITEKIWNFLASIKTGMSLVALIALVNFGGSFIIQSEQAQEGQLERAYSPETLAFLDRWGLLDIYHSWWFILILTITAVSLIIASIDIWPRYWARVKKWKPKFPGERFDFADFKKKIPCSKADPKRVQELLERSSKKVWTGASASGSRDFFFQKGCYAHLGVFVIHTGLLLILIGGGIGTKFGFEGQVRLREGESSKIYIDERGRGKAQPLGFWIKANDVRIEKYDNGSPKAYYSDLEIIDQGKIVKTKTIKVNDPFDYQGIYFYQASYGTEPINQRATIYLRVRKGQKGKEHAMSLAMNEAHKFPWNKGSEREFRVIDYAPNFELPMEGHVRQLGEAIKIKIKDGKKEEELWLFKQFPNFDATMRKGAESFVLDNVQIDYDVTEFTGLLVAYNPGVWTVWIGSTILLFGLMWTFFAWHRKIWVRVDHDHVLVLGHVLRNDQGFDRYFNKIVTRIEKEIGIL
jgi:cytochrome c biogenesis protein